MPGRSSCWRRWQTRNLYKARFIIRRTDEIRFIVHSVFSVAGLYVLASFLTDIELSRRYLALATVAITTSLVFEREAARLVFRNARRSRAQSKPVLIIGQNEEANNMAEVLRTEPNLGYEVMGYIDAKHGSDPEALLQRIDLATADTGATGVLIASSDVDFTSVNHLVRQLSDRGLHVELTSRLVDIAPERLLVRPIGRFPSLYVEPAVQSGWRAAAKRTFDIFVAASIGLCTPAGDNPRRDRNQDNLKRSAAVPPGSGWPLRERVRRSQASHDDRQRGRAPPGARTTQRG